MLAPSSPWHLDYSDDSCTLTRSFGSGEDQVSLHLEQFSPDPAYEGKLFGKPFRAVDLVSSLRVAINDEAPKRISAISGMTGDKRPMLVFKAGFIPDDAKGDDGQLLSGSERLSVAQEATDRLVLEPPGSLRVLRIDPHGARPALVLRTGPMDKTNAAMRTCMDELLTHWGVDASAQHSLTRQTTPRSDPGGWLRSEDYPSGSLYRGESAIVHFRLTVAVDGSVSNCGIQQATRGPDFAKLTCDLIRRRARFDPALDAAGKPVVSYYVNAVRWLMSVP